MYFISILILANPFFCYADKILPRGRYAEIVSPAMIRPYEVIVVNSTHEDAITSPFLRHPAISYQRNLMLSGPEDFIQKRTILEPRQSCDPGYGYCEGEIMNTNFNKTKVLKHLLSVWIMLS